MQHAALIDDYCKAFAYSKEIAERMLEYLIDTVAGISAATMVSPIVGTIDKSIIAHVSGKEHMYQGLRNGFSSLLRNPVMYYKNKFVIYVWVVYSGTYLTANYIETTCRKLSVDWNFPTFLGTSAVNVLLCVWKDKLLATMYSQTPRPVPLSTFTLFTVRDCMTVAASFNFPPLISTRLQQNSFSKPFSDTISQLVTPCAVQLVSTPIHLLALDIYNNPQKNTSQRLRFVQREYAKSVIARIGRIFPAFGLGGVGNKQIKAFLYKKYF